MACFSCDAAYRCLDCSFVVAMMAQLHLVTSFYGSSGALGTSTRPPGLHPPTYPTTTYPQALSFSLRRISACCCPLSLDIPTMVRLPETLGHMPSAVSVFELGVLRISSIGGVRIYPPPFSCSPDSLSLQARGLGKELTAQTTIYI